MFSLSEPESLSVFLSSYVLPLVLKSQYEISSLCASASASDSASASASVSASAWVKEAKGGLGGLTGGFYEKQK